MDTTDHNDWSQTAMVELSLANNDSEDTLPCQYLRLGAPPDEGSARRKRICDLARSGCHGATLKRFGAPDLSPFRCTPL